MQRQEYLERCLDNTALPEHYEQLGLLFFARTFLEPCMDIRQAPMHYDMMRNALELYNPKRTVRTERQVYNLVHRDGAKSTHYSYVLPLFLLCATGLPLYIRVERNGWEGSDMGRWDIQEVMIPKEYIVICSETSGRAKQALMNVRTELSTNRMLAHVFGSKKPTAADGNKEDLWTQQTFVTVDGSILSALGTGQQIRGMNISGRRPSTLIFDDLYSAKGVLTEETREKTRYWFFSEALNSLDSLRGKALLVGTVVHQDTVLVDVQKNDQWYGFKYPIIGQSDLAEVLRHCVINYDDKHITLPPKETLDALSKRCTSLSWPARLNLSYIMSQYKEKFELGRLGYFYQELLHILQSPDDERFLPSMFTYSDIVVTHEYGRTWAEFTHQDIVYKGMVSLVVSVDLAASEALSADNTAIVVSGWCHAYPQTKGDIFYQQQTNADKRNGISIPVLVDAFVGKADIYSTERTFGQQRVLKPGVVNVIEGFIDRYRPESVVIETTAVQSLIAREVKRALQQSKRQVPVRQFTPLASHGKKEERITNIMLPLCQSSKAVVVHRNKSTQMCVEELLVLGLGQHDDACDAWSLGMMYAKKPHHPLDYQDSRSMLSSTTASSIYSSTATASVDWETF